MIVWTPGISLDAIEEKVISAALSFYRDEERAADSLKITHKEMRKKLVKYAAETKKREEQLAEDKRKHEEFVLRARGITTNNSINF
jgi:hypothetical protein